MKNGLKLIIAGFGGQGILFTGKLLAHSAMLEGRDVTWFPSYGAEIRGGTANCTVIISDEMVGSPVVKNPDALLIMNDASLQRFVPRLKPDGILIMNASLIKSSPERSDIEIIRIKATDAAEELGNPQAANMVLLGALIGRTGIINFDTACSTLREIISERKKDTVQINESALRRGLQELRR